MPASTPTIERIWASLLALLLGYSFVVEPARQVWLYYWLVKDGQESVAIVTKEHWAGHELVVYQYRVNQQEYTGQDFRSYRAPRYVRVMPGEKTLIYFSASHPWLSAINRPRTVMVEGLPVVLLVWAIEVLLIGTVINPRGRWALKFSGQREAPPTVNKLG